MAITKYFDVKLGKEVFKVRVVRKGSDSAKATIH
jgi:hypothetical protein